MAQSLLPSLSARQGLTHADLDRMNNAAARLYENQNQPIGTVEQWRNPDTKNSGSVKLLRRFETNGMPCWLMEYTIQFERMKRHPRQYRVNWCRTAQGELKMVEPRARAAGT
jgi:hypothetical protein